MISKGEIIGKLHELLQSPRHKERLATIHRHYPNLKSEGRYRDALLELFNDSDYAKDFDLRAYAEVDKADMVVTQPGDAEAGLVRIEFKYHFTYDMWHRVNRALEPFENAVAMEGIEAVLDKSKKGDLRAIVSDCIRARNGNRCDLFVLIVQDRSGFRVPAYQPPSEGAGTRWTCPEVMQRGVRINFLNEQVNFDLALDGAASHERAWKEPVHKMFELIRRHRPFVLLDETVVRVEEAGQGRVPLTSHMFLLDFTNHRLEAASGPAQAYAAQTWR